MILLIFLIKSSEVILFFQCVVSSNGFHPSFRLFSLVAGLRYLKTHFGSPGLMGNEASSVRIHGALTAEDIKVGTKIRRCL